jgi:hypothetical protein
MPCQIPHTVTCLVVRNVQRHANHQNQRNRGPVGISQLPPTKRCVSVPAGKRDSSQGRSSIASPIQGQNTTPSSSLNNCRIADIPECVASTPSATQRRAIITPNATLGTCSHNTPGPNRYILTDSTRRVVSCPLAGIASTPTPPSCLENLPTPISNPEAHAIIANPLQTQATEWNQRQRQWQLQTQAVSTP